MLLAVIATVSYFALSGSSKKTIDAERTVVDAIELKGSQVQELLSVISKNASPGSITLELLNYGKKDIVIEKVFVDGNPFAFAVSDSDGNVFPNNTITPREITELYVGAAGQSIQIVTSSKNIINLPLN
jgi:hypothetical protein